MSKAEQLSLDRISTLPQPIIDSILSLLPSTAAAARTSILSREWRYKWITIPTLELYHKKRQVSEQTSGTRCKPCSDIRQLLSLHQGPIHDLILQTSEEDCLEFEKIILHLSRNHPLKTLALHGSDLAPDYKLPISVFSFHHITYLNLSHVHLDHPPIFNGFGSLKSLYLWDVGIPTKTLLHLLSNCPSLKKLGLFAGPCDDDVCTNIELFQCLPAIEHLTTSPFVFEWLKLDSIPPELPISLVHLKYICFEDISRVDGYTLAFLLFLIKCSPNLEKIKLESYDSDFFEECSIIWGDYSDVWLEHLNELHIECFTNYEPEMEFVKFILARSPRLKKVTIYSMVNEHQQMEEMLKTLLQAPRVSPVVITVW